MMARILYLTIITYINSLRYYLNVKGKVKLYSNSWLPVVMWNTFFLFALYSKAVWKPMLCNLKIINNIHICHIIQGCWPCNTNEPL